MNESELWEIGSIERTKTSTSITLKKGNSTLELYAIVPPPTSWSPGDKIAEPTLRGDSQSKTRVIVVNKTKGGQISADILKASGDIINKSLEPSENMEYPHLGEEQEIIEKDPPRIRLGDDCKSVWYLDPSLSSLPEEWNVGDPIIVSHAGPYRAGDKVKNYKLTNTRLRKNMPITKYERLGTWENPGEKIPESYKTEKGRKGVIDNAPADAYDVAKGKPGKFNKFGEELTIETLDEKFARLTDGSYSWKFRWHPVLGRLGEWKRGDRVVVTKPNEKIDARAYTMMNVKTEMFLTITPAEEDE